VLVVTFFVVLVVLALVPVDRGLFSSLPS